MVFVFVMDAKTLKSLNLLGVAGCWWNGSALGLSVGRFDSFVSLV